MRRSSGRRAVQITFILSRQSGTEDTMEEFIQATGCGDCQWTVFGGRPENRLVARQSKKKKSADTL